MKVVLASCWGRAHAKLLWADPGGEVGQVDRRPFGLTGPKVKEASLRASPREGSTLEAVRWPKGSTNSRLVYSYVPGDM